jgi:hypothetical protein
MRRGRRNHGKRAYRRGQPSYEHAGTRPLVGGRERDIGSHITRQFDKDDQEVVEQLGGVVSALR